MKRLYPAVLFVWLIAANAGGQDCADAISQKDINECTNHGASKVETRLASLMKELRHALPSESWQALEKSQKFWEQSRELDCGVQASFFEGGSVQPSIVNACYEERTIERMHQLRYWLCPEYAMTGDCSAVMTYQ